MVWLSLQLKNSNVNSNVAYDLYEDAILSVSFNFGMLILKSGPANQKLDILPYVTDPLKQNRKQKSCKY